MRDCIRIEPKNGNQFDLELCVKEESLFTVNNCNECKLLSTIVKWYKSAFEDQTFIFSAPLNPELELWSIVGNGCIKPIRWCLKKMPRDFRLR